MVPMVQPAWITDASERIREQAQILSPQIIDLQLTDPMLL